MMKIKMTLNKLLKASLVFSLFMSGCGKPVDVKKENKKETAKAKKEKKPLFNLSFDDEGRKKIAEDVYLATLESVDSSEYTIAGVDVVYLSEEYIDELVYNTRENEYFGYKLSFLDEHFEEQPYVFTINDKGDTVVRRQEALEMDEIGLDVLRNVATAAGVIAITYYLIPLAPAGSVIAVTFAGAAENAILYTEIAGAIGAIGGAIAAANKEGADTTDILKGMALNGSKGMKVGAIGGVISAAAMNTLPIENMTLPKMTGAELAKFLPAK